MKAKLMLSFCAIAFFAFSGAKMLAGGNQPLLPKLGTDGAGAMGVQPLKYSAKEFDRENGLDLYDSKARWYAPQIGRTSTLDPMAEKYPHLSPYLWCAANPITLTDPTGKELKPKGEEELQVIKNTIPAEARRFVVINDEGFIDKNKLEEYSGDSYNFQILKYIVNSPITMFVELNDNYNYIDENGELKNIKEINVSYLKRLYQNKKFLYGGFSDDWYKK